MNQKAVRLTPEQKEKILRDMWIVHDGRWFIKLVIDQGYEKAAEMNQKVIQSFAKYEIKRLLQEIEYNGINSIEDLYMIIEIMSDLTFPEGFKPVVRIKDEKTVEVHIEGCYVHQNVDKAGFTPQHVCTAYVRCSNWFKALGTAGDVVTQQTIQNCNGTCDILFKLQ